MIGKDLKVLWEHENHNGAMYGWSSNYVRVKAPMNAEMDNKFSTVKIGGIEDNFCTVDKSSNISNKAG